MWTVKIDQQIGPNSSLEKETCNSHINVHLYSSEFFNSQKKAK